MNNITILVNQMFIALQFIVKDIIPGQKFKCLETKRTPGMNAEHTFTPSNSIEKMKFIIILSAFVLLFISCQQPDKKVISAEFRVDRSLLSDSSFASKTGFSINPPKNWLKTESFNSELQNKVLYRLDNKLLAIYKSDSTNCALIISELPEANFEIIKGRLGKTNSYSKQDSIWTNVKSSIFMYKSYEIIQVVSQNSNLVIFKLITHRLSEVYELDYILPRSEININLQSVESSIGSLN